MFRATRPFVSPQNNTPTHTKVSIGDTLAQVYSLYTRQVAQIVSPCPYEYKPMSNKLTPQPDSLRPTIYQIRIKGHLDSQWADWFEDLTITLEEGGETLLTGPVLDQAALHGLLKKVRDLGMPLLSVNHVEPCQG
jgi:hypothetical protein